MSDVYDHGSPYEKLNGCLCFFRVLGCWEDAIEERVDSDFVSL